MAEVIPFPLARRRAFVRRHAEYACRMTQEKGRRHIDRQIEDQRRRLVAKGVDPVVADNEAAALSIALTCAVWQVVMQGGAA